jgi:hypothetical protein
MLLIFQELPDFIIPLFEKHTQLWAKDIEDTIAMLMTKHGTRMSDLARDVISAIKDQNTPTTPVASPQIATEASNLRQAEDINAKCTPETRFWNDAVQFAQEVELSKEKSNRQNHKPQTPPSTPKAQTDPDLGSNIPTYYEIESPSFSLFSQGEGWSQQPPKPTSPTDHDVEEADVADNAIGARKSGLFVMFRHLAYNLY